MKPIIRLFALFSLLTLTKADVIGSHDTVKVVDGEDAILPCQLKKPFSSTVTVLWKRNGTIVHLYRSKADDPDNQDKNFLGRTSLFPDELAKGNFSLTLTNVTELDAGNYTCKGRINDLSGKALDKYFKITLIVEPRQSKGNLTNILGQSKGNTTDSPGLQDYQVIVIIFGVIVIVLIFIGAVIYFRKRNANPEPAPATALKPAQEPAPEPETMPEHDPNPEPEPEPEPMPEHDPRPSPRWRGYIRQRSKETDSPEETPLMNKGSTSDSRT